MILKSYEIQKKISDLLKYNLFLTYGENTGLKNAMEGLDINEIPEDQMLQKRGW